MDDDLITTLKAYVEGRISHEDWRIWWGIHESSVEEQCDRFTYLRLKKQGFSGARKLLEDRGISFQSRDDLCRQCGEVLFVAMPGVTKLQDMERFAHACKLACRNEIMEEGWIHPGKYCPNGCTTILWEFGDRLPVVQESPRGEILIRTNGSIDLRAYKVYVDGNISGGVTGQAEEVPARSTLLRPEVGRHRIVVREYDAQKVGRLESNTVHFDIQEGEKLVFDLALGEGEMLLSLACD